MYNIELSYGLYIQPISSFYSNRVLIITIRIRAQIWAFKMRQIVDRYNKFDKEYLAWYLFYFFYGKIGVTGDNYEEI